MKKWLALLFITGLAISLWFFYSPSGKLINPLSQQALPKEKLYDKYSFERLAARGGVTSKIEIGRKIADYPEYVSYMFYYQSEGRKISGQINLPNLSRLMAVVVMARGYVEKEDYKTGIGTKNAAAVYAKNGYITLAPDFSGYGESDLEDENSLGARLTKPVEILDLIASLISLPQADLTKVYLWGHSNGGQIMLSVSEILGMGANSSMKASVLGTTLWAPVSKPFPYNILFYTDEASDSGKWLRGQIANFEQDYDVFNFSIDKYIERINIPIQLHQGSSDEAVPKKWSDDLAKTFREKDIQINYYVYPGADHNLKPGWDNVVARDVEWFNQLAK